MIAFDEGNHSPATVYLGAMTRYVGNVSQYGARLPHEVHHRDYQRRAPQSGPEIPSF